MNCAWNFYLPVMTLYLYSHEIIQIDDILICNHPRSALKDDTFLLDGEPYPEFDEDFDRNLFDINFTTEFRQKTPVGISDIDQITHDSKITPLDFNCFRVLGKGSFGTVVLSRKKSIPSQIYAIKILNKANLFRRNQVFHTITERNVLAKLNHPFIIKYTIKFCINESNIEF